jgi:hypothetical protein
MLPFEKRTFVATSQELSKLGFAEWLAGRINEIQTHSMAQGVRIITQSQVYGGKHSAFRNNDPEGKTALSWRDHTLLTTFDIFYEPSTVAFSVRGLIDRAWHLLGRVGTPKEFTLKIQHENDEHWRYGVL